MDATRPRTRAPAGRGGSYGSRSVQRNLVGFARLVAGFGSAVGRPIWGCVAPTPVGRLEALYGSRVAASTYAASAAATYGGFGAAYRAA